MQAEVELWKKDIARMLLMGEDYMPIPRGYVSKTTNGYINRRVFGDVIENDVAIQTDTCVTIKAGGEEVRYTKKYQTNLDPENNKLSFHRYSGPAFIIMKNDKYRHVSFSLYGELYDLDEWCGLTNKSRTEYALFLLKYGKSIMSFKDEE